MEFSGTFELEDTTVDEVWLALSDPVMIERALPGCQFLLEVDSDDPDFDELRERAAEMGERELTIDPEVIEGRAFREGATYAALMEISVGAVSPSFKTVVTIDDRSKPRMEASGEGESGAGSFEMSSWMELSETDDGTVSVEWYTDADVFGRIAQMGQRVINPAANRIVKRFFSSIQSQIESLSEPAEEEGAEEEAAAETTEEAAAESDRPGGFRGLLARIKRLLGIGG